MDFFYEITVESTFYLWGSLLLLPLWIYSFVNHKGCRKEMIICGTLFGFAAILIAHNYAIHDYWSPPYIFNNVFYLEDFIYGFLFGGIAAEIFEITFGFKETKQNKKKKTFLLPIFLAITVLSFFLFVNLLGWNSIVAHIVPPLIIGLFCIFLRRDFLLPTILSGIIMLVITFLWQSLILAIYPNAIIDFWMIENLSGIFINGIPIEELIFAFALGFGASCFYELVMGYEYVKKTRSC